MVVVSAPHPVQVIVVVLHAPADVIVELAESRGHSLKTDTCWADEHGIVDVVIPDRPEQPVVSALVTEHISVEALFASVTVEQIFSEIVKVCSEHELELLDSVCVEGVPVVGSLVGVSGEVTGVVLPSGPRVDFGVGLKSPSSGGGPIGGNSIFGAGGKPWKNQVIQDQ